MSLNSLAYKWDVMVLLNTNFGNNFFTSVLVEVRLYYVKILQEVKIQCHVCFVHKPCVSILEEPIKPCKVKCFHEKILVCAMLKDILVISKGQR